jgi:hypothetical protein
VGLKQLDDAILGNAFPLADDAHGGSFLTRLQAADSLLGECSHCYSSVYI